MTIWVTADHHFGHTRILEYCKRPFADVKQMDLEMIQRWNAVVQADDIVYHVGDFTLSGRHFARKIFMQLNGHIYVLPGSHDQMWFISQKEQFWSSNDQGIVLCPQMVEIEVDGKIVVMSHYAMRVWPRSHYGTYHLYGHSHGQLPGQGRSMDVGVDTNNFYPYLLDDVLAKLEKEENINQVKELRSTTGEQNGQ